MADALVNAGFCTKAVPSGDMLSGPKWTNPDVVGLIEPDVFARAHGFPTKIVAVEIKRAEDSTSLLTGFAEACAYLDFAHISWLVVPWCDNDTIWRVERLCACIGLGLAYAYKSDQEDEDQEEVLLLQVGVYPRCHKPGARELNEFLKRLDERDIKL